MCKRIRNETGLFSFILLFLFFSICLRVLFIWSWAVDVMSQPDMFCTHSVHENAAAIWYIYELPTKSKQKENNERLEFHPLLNLLFTFMTLLRQSKDKFPVNYSQLTRHFVCHFNSIRTREMEWNHKFCAIHLHAFHSI